MWFSFSWLHRHSNVFIFRMHITLSQKYLIQFSVKYRSCFSIYMKYRHLLSKRHPSSFWFYFRIYIPGLIWFGDNGEFPLGISLKICIIIALRNIYCTKNDRKRVNAYKETRNFFCIKLYYCVEYQNVYWI